MALDQVQKPSHNPGQRSTDRPTDWLSRLLSTAAADAGRTMQQPADAVLFPRTRPQTRGVHENGNKVVQMGIFIYLFICYLFIIKSYTQYKTDRMDRAI